VVCLCVLISQCLDRPDPPSERPKLLHVQVRGFQTVDISKVSVEFHMIIVNGAFDGMRQEMTVLTTEI
jgi:hypothetical protein